MPHGTSRLRRKPAVETVVKPETERG